MDQKQLKHIQGTNCILDVYYNELDILLKLKLCNL